MHNNAQEASSLTKPLEFMLHNCRQKDPTVTVCSSW